jgi:hypothetical protein
MQHHWRSVSVVLADDLSPRQVMDHLHAQIRVNAGAAGEFVQQIRLGLSKPYSVGFRQWSADYLPGPPAG